MARPIRIEYPGAWYHVMNRGAGRRKIYRDEADYVAFLNLLGDLPGRFNVEVHTYCLMGNHYHLLLHTPEGNLSRAMRHLNGVYTQTYNYLHKTDGPLFRGRFKSILVQADPYLLALSCYIHRNPLEAGMVKKLTQYRWSSYPAYIGKVASPEWLQREFTYGLMQQRRPYRRYQNYVEGDNHNYTVLPANYDPGQPTGLLGDEAFIERYQPSFKEISVEQYPAMRQARQKPLQQILALVAKTYGVSVEDVKRTKRGRGVRNWPRLVSMWLAQRYTGLTQPELAKHFNVGHYATLSRAASVVKKTIKEDKALARTIHEIKQKL